MQLINVFVHLENGQRVWFTEENAEKRGAQTQNTTLTVFSLIVLADHFAKILLYHAVPKRYTWNTTSKISYRTKRGAVVSDYAGVRLVVLI